MNNKSQSTSDEMLPFSDLQPGEVRTVGKGTKTMTVMKSESGAVGMLADAVPVAAIEGLLKKLEKRRARLNEKDGIQT